MDKKKELVARHDRLNDRRMYSIIGGDGKTYGPVSAEEVLRWIREGRADGKTKIKPECALDWQELGSIPEFFPVVAPTPPKLHSLPSHKNLEVATGLRIGSCLSQAWQTYRQDPWRITGIIVLVFLLQFLMNSIPLVGPVLAFLLNGPILGGVYFLCRQAIHGKMNGLGDITGTVRERFLPCFLATTVSSLLAFGPFILGLIPAAALFASSGVSMEKLVEHHKLLVGMGLPVLAGTLGMFYLLIGWSLAVPLAACTATDFWEALKMSWRGVRQNFWSYLGLLCVLGVINVLGILCFVITPDPS
ncbi:MAG: hypothetical protein NTZ01_05915 [Verrucomicrobia bacterium]|nr:hypothetical protein [Verrucomicrobiota bacterium]